MGRACNTHVGDNKCVQNLVGKPEGKRPLERPRRGQDNIKIDLKVIVWEGVNWLPVAQDGDRLRALMNTVMNLRIL
jgi:hypothetical protein